MRSQEGNKLYHVLAWLLCGAIWGLGMAMFTGWKPWAR